MPALFIEEGATVEAATINLKDGPVYIGRNAHVMEGSCLRGPLALCADAKIRMGSKIYGGSTFGPFCKVGARSTILSCSVTATRPTTATSAMP